MLKEVFVEEPVKEKEDWRIKSLERLDKSIEFMRKPRHEQNLATIHNVVKRLKYYEECNSLFPESAFIEVTLRTNSIICEAAARNESVTEYVAGLFKSAGIEYDADKFYNYLLEECEAMDKVRERNPDYHSQGYELIRSNMLKEVQERRECTYIENERQCISLSGYVNNTVKTISTAVSKDCNSNGESNNTHGSCKKRVGNVEDTARHNKDEYNWFKCHKTQPIKDRAALIECIRMLSTKGTDFDTDVLMKLFEKAGINAETNRKKSRISIYVKGKKNNVYVAGIEAKAYGGLTVKCMYNTSTLMTTETESNCSDEDVRLIADMIAYAVTAGKDTEAKNNTAIQRVKAVSYVANKYNMYRNEQAHAELSSSGSVEGVITGEGRGYSSYMYEREINVNVDDKGISVSAGISGVKWYRGAGGIKHDRIETAYAVISAILKELNNDVMFERCHGRILRFGDEDNVIKVCNRLGVVYG